MGRLRSIGNVPIIIRDHVPNQPYSVIIDRINALLGDPDFLPATGARLWRESRPSNFDGGAAKSVFRRGRLVSPRNPYRTLERRLVDALSL